MATVSALQPASFFYIFFYAPVFHSRQFCCIIFYREYKSVNIGMLRYDKNCLCTNKLYEKELIL